MIAQAVAIGDIPRRQASRAVCGGSGTGPGTGKQEKRETTVCKGLD